MKHLLSLLLLLTLSVNAQKKIVFTILKKKTDSTSLRVLPNVLMHEKIFGNTNEYHYSLLFLNDNGTPMLSIQQLQKKISSRQIVLPKFKIVLQLMNGKL